MIRASLHYLSFFLYILPPPPRSTLFPYTTLFRSRRTTPCSSVKRALVRRPSLKALRSGSSRVMCKAFNDGRLTNRSEEHTSELQSRPHLVCRLLLEKKKLKVVE